jgi:hypothetical protein
MVVESIRMSKRIMRREQNLYAKTEKDFCQSWRSGRPSTMLDSAAWVRSRIRKNAGWLRATRILANAATA